jgi:hypothetical protein
MIRAVPHCVNERHEPLSRKAEQAVLPQQKRRLLLGDHFPKDVPFTPRIGQPDGPAAARGNRPAKSNRRSDKMAKSPALSVFACKSRCRMREPEERQGPKRPGARAKCQSEGPTRPVLHGEEKELRSAAAIVSILLAFACAGVAYSESGQYSVTKTITFKNGADNSRPWRVVAYEGRGDEQSEPDVPIKLCFFPAGSDTPSQCEKDRAKGGIFFIGLEATTFCKGGEACNGVLLTTNTYAIGGGPFYHTLWVYEKKLRRFKALLSLRVPFGPQSTYKFFPDLHGKSILVTACPGRLLDYEADIDDPERETIWSPHRYRMNVYQYSSRTGFIRKGSFETKRKYDPENDLDKVIDSEMKRIQAVVK